LHFGIYQGGPINPFPFLQPDDPVPPSPRNTDYLSTWVRVTASRAPLGAGPRRDSTSVVELARESAAMAMATTGSRLRIMLPDGMTGYVDNAAVAVATTPLRQRRVQTPSPLRDRPRPDAPAMTTIEEGSPVQVLGRFGNFELVRTANGTEGWLVP